MYGRFGNRDFYAYYPYKENITIDMTKEDPFETIVGNWTVDTDLSGDRYTNNDLMTGRLQQTEVQ